MSKLLLDICVKNKRTEEPFDKFLFNKLERFSILMYVKNFGKKEFMLFKETFKKWSDKKKFKKITVFFFKILKCNKNWIYYSRKWKVLETFFLLVFMSKKEDSKFFFLCWFNSYTQIATQNISLFIRFCVYLNRCQPNH